MNCRLLPVIGAVLLAASAPVAAQAPAPKPPATFSGRLTLVRYDMPRAFSDGYAPTRQPAVRRDEADAVDWPEFTLNGQPIWRDASDATVPLRLRRGAEAGSPFRQAGDEVIDPGGHWFRAMEWRLRRKHLYTADRSARCSNAADAPAGHYELWAFPVLIRGEGGPVVKNVELRVAGKTIYRRAGPWRSLTLLLAQNEPGQPYELLVDGRGPVKFSAGLAPVKLGNPHERLLPVNLTIPGDGAKIVVRNLPRPAEFPHPREWAADVAELAKPLPVVPETARNEGLERWLGAEVPRSPFTIYAAALPLGMSGGFFRKGLDLVEYAGRVADAGYDAIFDPVTSLPPPGDGESIERRAAVFARHGLRLGVQYDNNWTRPSLQHPGLALFAHTLPDWHAPLYRSLSLTAQRFARLPNFAGIDIGAGNAGYVSFWPWAPPIPDRPWGEAMTAFMGSATPRMPRAPSLGKVEADFEQAVGTQAEFIRYVERYENAFRQYGYFAEAVREVDPRMVFTTATFGSSPGTGGRGGWPWASVPGRVIFEGFRTQQAYDWNETRAAKPLHNVALVDRLRSYHPRKTTWALLDNYRFVYGRNAWQRACALALTRGIQGLGTNFLPAASGDGARPDVLEWQAEMHAWIRKYGGVFAGLEPVASIGIFYGHHQAVQRRVVRGETPPDDALLRGSHEGKVTEALFLSHAAGWPARVITFQELMRGPLPESMKAILLVGLDAPDHSWNWAEGLEPALKAFVARGGRILVDDESVCPVPPVETGLQVAAYVEQGNVDATPLLFARNRANVERLRAAMEGVPPPVAISESPTLWAIPAECGDVQYVTAINQAFAEGDEAAEMLRPPDPRAARPELWKTKGNASIYVPPQTGAIAWNSGRPIYDVRLGRKLTADESANVDLTEDAFRWYALPPAEVVAPTVTISRGVAGFHEAKVTMHHGVRMDGVPVQISVVRAGGAASSATVFAATGQTVRLPVHVDEDRGEFTATVTELLTGLATSVTFRAAPAPVGSTVSGPVRFRDQTALSRFAARKNVPLTVALTPEQHRDATLVAQARAVVDHYRRQGRAVSEKLGTVGPGGVVESLQPLRSPHRFPQWKTVPADLVLFGTPANNVLVRDQARGQLFPARFSVPAAGQAEILYTRSPFVGEHDVVNVIAADAGGIAAAVSALTSAPKTATR